MNIKRCIQIISLNLIIIACIIIFLSLSLILNADDGKNAFAFKAMAAGLFVIPLLSVIGIFNILSTLRISYLLTKSKDYRTKNNHLYLLAGVLGTIPVFIILIWVLDTEMNSSIDDTIVTPESILGITSEN